MPIYDSILATIGRTPIVRINKLAPKGVKCVAAARGPNRSRGTRMPRSS